ncbi:MAG TPA: TIGR02710 family CRISPR-associated CARF protein, partial [Chloroflexia bacterium]|nr:TIGR02710 family CRISPR-associated CARF protein [Chloroflexia bacterium]
DDIQQIQKGTSDPRPLTDPYAVYGDWAAEEAQHRFAAYDYHGAEQIFANLAGRVPEPERTVYQAYAELAKAYAAWDSFDLHTAQDTLAALLSHLPDTLAPQREKLERQQTALVLLNQFVKPVTDKSGAEVGVQIELQDLATLGDPAKVLPLLGTLYANGLRRGEPAHYEQAETDARHRRYDMAALLLYRCLELMAQHRLAIWEISTTIPDYSTALARSQLSLKALRDEYSRVLDEQNQKRSARGGHTSNRKLDGERYFGLFVGYMLLAALKDDLIRRLPSDCQIDRIEECAEARNQSALAHGYRLITQKDYQKFQTVTNKVLTSLFTTLAQPGQSNEEQARMKDEWQDTYTFVNPFAAPERPPA